MNILILGAGGREHCLAQQISTNSRVNQIFVSPGNGGTGKDFENLNIDLTPPFTDLLKTIEAKSIEWVIVGPEQYLIEGVVDILSTNKIKSFGVSRACAELEGSKRFAKEIMHFADVPTADYRVFTDYENAVEYIKETEPPYVLKADGLCAGKGVILTDTKEETLDALKLYFIEKKFGKAGETLIIEQKLTGLEASILAFCDGDTVKLLPPSQDHKRIGEGDTGLNTGGMGVFSPLPFLNERHLEFVENKILLPVLETMKQKGTPYKGILYAGLMVDGEDINVIEFNVRFGDPECQCVLPLLQTDLMEVIEACYAGKLDEIDFKLQKKTSCTVVMSAGGYPEKYNSGDEIMGLEKLDNTNPTLKVFHAGTTQKGKQIVTHGGRVLSVTALDDDFSSTQQKAYENIKKITFKDAYYRRDIGDKILNT